MKFFCLFFFALLVLKSHTLLAQEIPTKYFQEQFWDEWKLRTEDGCNLYIREAGHGPTILVIHGGFGAEQSYMYPAFMPLLDKYHFVFYDQRGSMRSLCNDSLITVKEHVEDIERIRKALNIDSLVIAAHSMGTYLAIRYAAEHPEHIKGLVLIGSVPAKAALTQFTSDLAPTALKRWERAEVLDTLKANGLSLERLPTYTSKQRWQWHRITFAAINLHSVKHWREMGGSLFYQEKANMLSGLSMDTTWDYTAQLKPSAKPIFVIHGEDDYLPITYHNEWLHEVPNAKLLTIKDAGHLSWIDQKADFNSKLKSALQAIYTK